MTLVPQYAGVGEICPAWQVQATAGGELSGGILYFSFQLQNRAGLNLASISEVIYSPNQKIEITIPSSINKPGWDIHAYILSASSTNDPTTFVQIARIPGFQYGPGINPQSIRVVLPQTITLSRDAHIALAPTVATPMALPVGNNRLDGQVRWVDSLSGFFEYRADSESASSVNVLTADIGCWHRCGSPNTYISDTSSGGSDRAITSINPTTVIQTPPYPSLNAKVLPTWEAQYWIYNKDGYALPTGIAFGIELEYNGLRSPDLLNGLFQIKFLGYVQANGTIRTTTSSDIDFGNVGGWVDWTPRKTIPFLTPDDLAIGEAIAIAVRPYFSVAELNNQFSPGSVISVLPSIRTQSGDFNPLGNLLPYGVVYDLGDRYRVVPNIGLSFDLLSGSALVASYDFPLKPRRAFGGLAANTANQKIIINGNGGAYVESPTYAPTSTEALRAIVGTVAGVSAAGTYSSYAAIALGGAVALTLSYPSAVRSDYPDVIALSNKAKFNPLSLNIYLQRQDTSEIRKFSGFLVIAGTTQQFTISDWASGITILQLPTANFSLFAPLNTTIQAVGGGNFAATNYRATYAFVYDGYQITSISHASGPCIREREGDFEPPSVEVNPTIITQSVGSPATVTDTGVGNNAYLTFSLPISEANFDAILTDSNGEVLVDSNGNVLYT